ncbi:MAG: AAA family ATPase [Thaumarchaeota archaeon]|nr:AAA family ATPase [Nitrososphaerota archaeon]
MSLRRISVENFGPIKKGTVDLKPLTVLIGPSNSGKSYMSALIYSVLSSETLRGRFRPHAKSGLRTSIRKELRALIRNNRGSTLAVPLDTAKRMYSLIIREIFDNHLKQNLERNFRMPLESLTRNNAAPANIKISTFADLVVNMSNNIESYKTTMPDTEYVFDISGNLDTFVVTRNESVITITISKKHKQKFLSQHAADLMISLMHAELWKKDTPRLIPFYFPASRSGILETYPETAASVMEDISYSVFTNVDEPTIGGIVTDFITPLILLERKKTPFFKLAEEMESCVLHGSVDARIGKSSPPRLLYTFDGNVIPLDNASSAVSELAPLSIYLKYVVQKSNLLIIEEPESHLHPHAQAILAKYIVKLVRAGLNILVTTHSAFLLAEFGKYVLAGRLDEKTRKTLKVETHLAEDEVSPYVFRRNRDKSYSTRRIPFDDEDGISQDEFGRVEHELYNQWLGVVSSLPKK